MLPVKFATPALLAVLPCVCLCDKAHAAPTVHSAIDWKKWSDDAFARAKKEHKFVLMDLEAVWCHWCHVMDEITYSDPDVIKLINEKYIAVKVDQDSRPDISSKYEDWGWPATVVFNADGGEIVKRQGYIPPGPMARMLQAIIDDPTPGPSVRPEKHITYGKASVLSEDLRRQLQERFDKNYDDKQAGWGVLHKYLDWDAIEFCADRARAGDKQAEERARRTLTAALKLIDPAWGGIYQYSTDGDWDHPHYEKIMQFQAEVMRTYAQAFAQWQDPSYLNAARAIRRFLATFLTSPEGPFYTSQNADLIDGEHSASYFVLSDRDRRKLGIPRVDRHIYARENGWAIGGLAALYDVTGDPAVLDDAIRAAQWINSHRSLEGGGFSHDQKDVAGPYLGDTLAMARAFLSLYAATADRSWLARAEASADFIAKNFHARDGAAGFLTASATSSALTRPELDENVAAARFFNLLIRYSGQEKYRAAAHNAMCYLTTPQVAEARGAWGAGILLADLECSSEPLLITIVGPKQDGLAASLFREAIKSPVGYKRVEWWDPSEGPLPNPDVQYPQKKPAAFLCTSNTCSAPITNPEMLARRIHLEKGSR